MINTIRKMYKNRCEGLTKLNKRCKNTKHMDLCFCCIHKPPENCSICLEEINDKIKLTCNHVFCKECIFTWLCKCNTFDFYCPICKTSISEKIKSEAWNYGLDNNLLYRVRIIKYNVSNISREEYNIIKDDIHVFENCFLIKHFMDTIILSLSSHKFSIFMKIVNKMYIYYRLKPKLEYESIPEREYFYISNETYL
jgi:hypothetical protein